MSNERELRFGLAKLLPLGIAAVLVPIAWSGQSSARLATDEIASNEKAAIAALRTLVSAQARLAASGAIDTDDDGVGEYGYFGELAGTALLRFYDPVLDVPDLGAPRLNPPLLPRDFANLFIEWAHGDSVLLRNGYVFKMFLPDVEHSHRVEGIAEDGAPGIGGSSGGGFFPDADTGESLWCCYAWPFEDQVSGHRVFFVNQKGVILQTRNDLSPRSGPVYDGLYDVPEYDAAFSDVPETPNGLTGMAAPPGSLPRRANDGNVWTSMGG